jgi:hypothetical protein
MYVDLKLIMIPLLNRPSLEMLIMVHIKVNSHFSCLWSSICTLYFFCTEDFDRRGKSGGEIGGLRCPRHPYRYRQRVLAALLQLASIVIRLIWGNRQLLMALYVYDGR